MESILIVDDERDNLEALKRLLRTEFEVTTTESGLDALKLIQAREYSVLVSDQRMPSITGVDLLEKAKLLRPAMVRILLTGYTEVESVIGAINRGSIYRYVAKPWDPEDLKITIRQAAEAYRLKQELDAKNSALVASNLELESALRQLTLLDQAKARFLALVSHELNTPLTAVTAFVGLLNEHATAFAPELQRAVSSLAGASDRLAEIVRDVLSYVRMEAASRWDSGVFEWDKETVAVVGGLEAARAFKQVDVAVQGKAGVTSHCAVEPTRVALSKLVEEGIRRSPKGERVTVAFRALEGGVRFRVSWRGAPLPDEAFAAFEPAVEEKHHHRNLALGLAIARLAVQKQGGTLASEPSTDSGTACLRMDLPSRRLP